MDRRRIYAYAVATVFRSIPEVVILARIPPLPLRNLSAPGVKARFIHSQGALSAVPKKRTPRISNSFPMSVFRSDPMVMTLRRKTEGDLSFIL